MAKKKSGKSQSEYEAAIGHAGAQKNAPKSLKKFRDRMVDDEYEVRRKGAKPKAGPGFKKGGKVKKGKKK